MVYWDLAKRFRTPLVITLDRNYRRTSVARLYGLLQEVRPMIPKWAEDESDCDDAAFILKGEASKRRRQWIGIAWGWFGRTPIRLMKRRPFIRLEFHLRNVALVFGAAVEVEPQNMEINPKDGFRAVIIVI